MTDRDAEEFGRWDRAQREKRWRKALADYGFPFELAPGHSAQAALDAARRKQAGRAVTPIILAPGNWNSEPMTPQERIVQALEEIADIPPTAALGRDYLARQAAKWQCYREDDAAAPDLTLFERLAPVPAKPPETGIYLLKDFLYPKMDRVLWPQVAIVEVPTPHHHEVPVYLDWGNWNEVPPSVELAAVTLYWQDKYGARLIAVGNDQLEFSVQRKPATFADACAVFHEHFLFGPDPVEFKAEALAQYSADLLLQDTWVFWWD